MRVAKTLLIASLMALPTVVFANDYTLAASPNVELADFFVTNSLASGAVYTSTTFNTITDLAVGSGANANVDISTNILTFSLDTSAGGAFSITGQNLVGNSSATVTFLSGTESSYTNLGGGETEALITLSPETQAEINEWSALENTNSGLSAVTASSFGTTLAVDFHELTSADGTEYANSYADFAPPAQTTTVTPEPASMTLLLGGLAAGLVRKRRAANAK